MMEDVGRRMKATEHFKMYCRNCFMAGKGGYVRHSIGDCVKAGNPCYMPCKKCNDGSAHWMKDCPNKS